MPLCSMLSQGYKVKVENVFGVLSLLLVLLVLPEAASPLTIEKETPTEGVVRLKPDEEIEFKVKATGTFPLDGGINYIVFDAAGEPEKSGDEKDTCKDVFIFGPLACQQHSHKIKFAWPKIGYYKVTATVYARFERIAPKSVEWQVKVALPPPEITSIVPDRLYRKTSESDIGIAAYETTVPVLVSAEDPNPTTFQVTATSVDDKIDYIEFRSSAGTVLDRKEFSWWRLGRERTHSYDYDYDEWSQWLVETTVTAVVNTEKGCRVIFTWKVKVIPPNRHPVPTQGSSQINLPLTVDEIRLLDMSEYFSDPDNDILTYTAKLQNPSTIGLELRKAVSTGSGIELGFLELPPSWNASDYKDYKLAIVPKKVGTARFKVTASDGELTATQPFTVTITAPLTITAANQPPVAVGAIPNQTLTVNEPPVIEGVSTYFRDPDGDTLIYKTWSNNRAVATVSRLGSQVTITPKGVGSAKVTVIATDLGGLYATQRFMVTVGSPLQTSTDAPLSIYWTDFGEIAGSTAKIQRADLNGTNVQNLVTTGLLNPSSVALDFESGKVYWTDHRRAKIQRADLDGTNVQNLVTTGLRRPIRIALDVTGGKMYWTDSWSPGKIQRADLNGTNVQNLVTFTDVLSSPFGIALDVAGGKMYWTDNRAGKIQRANLNGTNVQNLVTTGLDLPGGIALDVANGKMYWTDTGRIQRANLDGSNVEDLIARTSGGWQPNDITLDVATGKMYWAAISPAKIQRADLDGTNIEDVVTTGLIRPYGIALSIPSPGPSLVGTVKAVVKLIYWTEDNRIYRSKPDGTHREVVLARPRKRLGRLALNVSGGKIYWTEFPISGGVTTLQRANLNGSGVESVVVDVGALTDLSLDTSGNKLYWAAIVGRFQGGKIRRSNLDGSWAEDLVTNLNPGGIALFELLESLALDISGGKMYWTEAAYKIREDKTVQIIAMGKIRRSNLDGSRVEDLVTGLSSRAIALDVLGGKMYWINNHASKLQRANLDGSHVENLVSVPNMETHFNLSLDVSDSKMYWGSTHVILRANLDGTQAEILYEVPEPLNNIIGDVAFAILPEETMPAAPSAASIVLAAALPKETAVLPNYPNPFNPETWIPYQLAEPADVTLSIYAVDGKLVRTLALGHQPAGVYQGRSHAAYWDGRNEIGEHVASGVYFYTLTAGEFTATRKMLIRK